MESRLVILDEYYPPNKGRKMAVCMCECGKVVEHVVYRVVSNKVRSCGCLRKELAKNLNLRHGLYKHPLKGVWQAIKKRCNNPNNKCYPSYGACGIKVCEEWDGVNFINFYNWVIENGWENGLEIDRIDNNKGYSPENCRIVGHDIQTRNRKGTGVSRYKGVSLNNGNKFKKCKVQFTDKNGVRYFLGNYYTEAEAAEMYNKHCMLEFPNNLEFLNKVVE